MKPAHGRRLEPNVLRKLREASLFVFSRIADVLYGSLPTPTFQLSDKRLQPDFLMDTFPDAFFFGGSMAIVLGIFYQIRFDYKLTLALVIPLIVHWALFFGHGLPQRSEKFFDLAGQLGMSAMLIFSLISREVRTARSDIVCLLALIWSLRLGYFLFTRFLERGADWRFVRAKNHPGFHFFTWTSQGLWCFFQGQSILTLNHTAGPKSPPLGTALDYLGLSLWAVGLGIEATADLQKLDFVRRFPHRTTRPWIEEGLWAYSRHPNFFGETLHWFGVAVLCLSGLHTASDYALCLFAPVFSTVFLMQTTVPWLDLLADDKYSRVDGYQSYRYRVSKYCLLPQRPVWL